MHPLQNKHVSTINLQKPRVAVKCELKLINRKKHLMIFTGDDTMVMLKDDTLLLPVDDMNVIDCDGNIIEPTGKFYMTAETIDPYHIVTDIF